MITHILCNVTFLFHQVCAGRAVNEVKNDVVYQLLLETEQHLSCRKAFVSKNSPDKPKRKFAHPNNMSLKTVINHRQSDVKIYYHVDESWEWS